ncbi:MAG: hypothetical protein A2Z16_06910 [Chloroflexi bacterium RBG_16_54_18]|nr:MAG: hypothetical protein A2Z16_06910 [Chloroflexi bacterium RBG_16_54_18]HLE53409.1 hypothetical protein [Anaerolineales bacterium]
MKTPFKRFLLFAVMLCLVALACQTLGISPRPENEGPQSTIYVQQTQLAEKGIPTQEGIKPTAEPGGELPTVPAEGQPPLPGMDLPVEPGMETNFEFLGQIGGSAYAVAVYGDIAYLGQGPRLVSLDVSTPAAPKLIGQSQVLPGIVLGAQLAGKYAYVAIRYGGLHILDISNPAHPALVSSIEPKTPGCQAVALKDNRAYLACNPSGLYIVDISSPQNPVELSSGSVPGTMLSIAVVGNYAYLVDVNSQGLLAVDVSNPESPQKVGMFTLMDVPDPRHESYSFSSVRVCGEYLCLAAVQDGLVVVDISNPAQPAFAGRSDTQVASGLAVDGSLVYLVDDLDGLHVLDVSRPVEPAQIGVMPTSVGGFEFTVEETSERGVFALGKTLYITDQAYGLTIVDVSQPGSPVRIGHYETPVPDWLFGIKAQGDYAYVIGRTSGFRVVNIADPGRLAEVSYDNSRKDLNLQVPSGLEVVGEYAFISDSNYPFHVYNISDPSKPVQVGAVSDFAASDGAHDIAISGNTAYLSGWGGNDAFYPGQGLWTIDISNPNDPQAAGFVDVPNERWSLAVSGSTLFALDGGIDEEQSEPLALRAFDLADPLHPAEVEKIPMLGMMPLMPSGILAAGEQLFASLPPPMGVKTFDISNPLKPVEVAAAPMVFANSPGLTKAGSYLFVSGLMAYDVADLSQPKIAGVVQGVYGTWACDVVNDIVYIVTQMQGLYIYRFKPLG